jgi:protein-L-isoaspartate(D-aspartate) O-methyltransferase
VEVRGGALDLILRSATPAEVPQLLLGHLALGSSMALLLGKRLQNLVVLTRADSGMAFEVVAPVAFVPMTGEAERKAADGP